MTRGKWWWLLAPVFVLLVVYTLGFAVFRVDCGEGPGGWHVDFSLAHSNVAMCEEISVAEGVVRSLT